MAEKESIHKAKAKTLVVSGATTIQKATPSKVAKVPLNAVDTAGGLFAWQPPNEAGAVLVTRVTVDVTTPATSACSLEIGTTAVSATTASANLIDTLDVHTAAITTDNLKSPGSNGKQLQKLAAGSWVTGSVASGASAGIVGFAYIEYWSM